MDEQKQNIAPIPINELKPKMRFEGKVIKIELFGALLDIGAERLGLLHISQMRVGENDHVNRVADVLTIGSVVMVWVKDVDAGRGLINLTMLEPLLYDWNDLKKDMQVTGKVTRVADFGAFVDFRGPRDGLIPAGQLSRERINKPSDVISEGDEVTAWVVSVEQKRERIGLSLLEPPALPWAQVKKGHTYRGKITRLERFGAFVDIGAERDGLVHVSELASGFIKDPSEVVAVGDEVDVKVLDVNPRKRQIQLSMKGISVQEVEAEEGEDTLPTSMEQAFRSAQRQPASTDTGHSQPPAQGPGKRQLEQRDILQRTLEQHQAQRSN
jgi:small subunit ribosomal protein S1